MTSSSASLVQMLREAEAELVAAQQKLSFRQNCETGWRINEALASVRRAIYSVEHPMPDSFYEGVEESP